VNHRLSLGLDVRYTAALCLLLGRGYQLVGPTQDMLVPFTGPDVPDLETAPDEARLRERGIVFRRATADDEEWVAEGVARELEASTPSRRWAYLTRQALRWQPPAIEIAEDVGRRAFLGFAAYDAGRWGMLGPMGVCPTAREHGVGTVPEEREG
jgi:hypothetical protein